MGVLEDKVELFQSRLITETLRQWIILVSFSLMFIVLASLVLTLIKTYRRLFAADIIMLLIIQTRILLTIIAEFLVPSQFLFFLSDIFHLVNLTVIFFMFIKNLLRSRRGILAQYKLYVGIISLVIIGLLVLGITQFDNNFLCGDSYDNHNIAVFIVQGTELAMAMLNLVLTVFIIREFKAKERSQLLSPEQRQVLNDMLNQQKDAQVKRFQITVMSIGLFIYTLLFVILSVLGDQLIYINESAFKCMHDMFFQPQSHISAIFQLFMSLLAMSPSILLLYVFYWIPKKYGKLSTWFGQKRLNVDNISAPSTDLILADDIDQITQPFIPASDLHNSYNNPSFYTNNSRNVKETVNFKITRDVSGHTLRD